MKNAQGIHVLAGKGHVALDSLSAGETSSLFTVSVIEHFYYPFWTKSLESLKSRTVLMVHPIFSLTASYKPPT